MILVTGATGFLGRNLCEYLARQGYAVRALVRCKDKGALLENSQVSLFQGDVTDAATMRQAVQGCDQVVHAAAHFRLWGQPEPFLKTNVEGTYHTLEAAKQAGVQKFIYISTIIVVGPQRANQVITEETICRPYRTDHYAQSKFLAERLAYSYVGQGLPVVILRLGALYGPHSHYAFNRLFFEEFLHNWRAQVEHGERIIFPCYVETAQRAIGAALRQGQSGEIYNVSDQSISHREANQIVSQLTGRSAWRLNIPTWLMLSFVNLLEGVATLIKREPFYPRNLKPYVFNDWIVDCRKAHRLLELQPTPFKEGAERTLAWYRRMNYW